MNPVTGILIYAVIWWLVLFMVLYYLENVLRKL